MKAYDIKLKPHDIPCLYLREDKYITLVTDMEHPYPCAKSRWTPTGGFNNSYANRSFNPDKIIFSTWVMTREDSVKFLEEKVPPCLEQELVNFPNSNRNLMIIYKEWDDDIEIGLGFWGDPEWIYPVIHEPAQKLLDKYLRLKTFW